MRDAIMFGYDSCIDYMNKHKGELNSSVIIEWTLWEMDWNIIQRLIEYCGWTQNQVYDAIIEWVERAYKDMAFCINAGFIA